MKTTIQLSKRELATTLAALRLWQHLLKHDISAPASIETDLHAIASDNLKHELLLARSIDRLCERINTSEPLHVIVEVIGGIADPVHVSHDAIVTIYDHDNIAAGDKPPLDLEKTTETMNTY